jgi:hypothetical protein
MKRFCALALLLPAAGFGQFAWKDLGDGRLELSENGKPALVYNYGPQLKAGAPENKRRCCYVYPLYTPAGVSMLDDFPRDHWHHRGLFWAWPVVKADGKTYDEWMNLTAAPREPKPPVTAGGANATLEAADVWTADGKDIVRENVKLTVLPASGEVREMDVTLRLEAVGGPVTLQGSREPSKSYGGFSARFAAREGTVLRADGETLAKDEDLTPRKWAELEGVYGGKRATLRITSDAANQWCLRNYGFVGASFPGRTPEQDGYTLEPGKPLTLHYRVRLW